MPDDKYDDTVVHEADGIQELDNKLPRWWVLMFYISIVYAVVYMTYFHVLDFGLGQEEQHSLAVAKAEQEQIAREAANAGPVNYDVPATTVRILATGEQVYKKNCISCHASDGGGGIGPNMTDTAWIHGSSFADSMKVIDKGGRPGKGMEAWEKKLSRSQRHAVASYIYTFRGTTPKSPKAPEGDFLSTGEEEGTPSGGEGEADAPKPSTDPLVLEEGQKIFLAECAACHTLDAGGLVGPNMTDDYWIHGPSFADNLRAIEFGSPEKGLAPYGKKYTPDQRFAVASYFYSIRGTTPAKPKAPEGKQYPGSASPTYAL